MSKPFEWANEESMIFMNRGYLEEGETLEEHQWQKASYAQSLLDNIDHKGKGRKDIAKKYYDYVARGFYSQSSPVLSNFKPTTLATAVSCFGTYIEDSIPSILRAHGEIGMMSKLGGGASAYFGNLRPRGKHIGTGGATHGSVHFIQMFETLVDVISQGNVRRGFMSPYLDMDHGDAEDFIKIRSEGHAIQQLTHGVVYSDDFMQRVNGGDKQARARHLGVIKNRREKGVPYIIFGDTINNNTVDVYKDKGMRIYASNMCVAGDDRVVTSKGYLTTKELYEMDEELTLFNGEMPVKASKMKLREKDADTYKITLDNGMEHTVTSYHGIPVVKDVRKYKVVRTECKDLRIGDKVPIQTDKGLFGEKSMEKEAFLLGLYQSDGTQHKDTIMLDVWENDFDILEEVQEAFNEVRHKYGCDRYEVKNQVTSGGVRKKRLSSKTLSKALNFQKGFVPDWVWESDEKTQWQYVRGLMIADGTVYLDKTASGTSIQVSYSDINKGFLKDLQLLMNNLGMKSSIRIPDGKGGHDYYTGKDCYRLIIINTPTLNEHTGLLDRKGIDLEDKEYRDNSKRYSEIVSIEYAGKQDVYCPTVYNDEHIFVSQGMKSFNCSEIALPSSPEESFVCVLSSMNVLKYDEWKDTDAVEVMVYFLDAVVEDFLLKMERLRDSESTEDQQAFYFMERAYRFAKRHRALGIGQLGWWDYLQANMIPFESEEAKRLNVEISKTIQERAWAASKQMAEEYGEPELLRGYGRRHTTLTAIAPTKSSSFILGQTSQGIEPRKSNYYIDDLAKTKSMFKNHYLEKVLEKYGKNTREVWNDIANHNGSVQHLDFLSELEKDVFKAFYEVSQDVIIEQAGDRQNWIDQSQSLNLMGRKETTPKEMHRIIDKAWKCGVKSLYYNDTENAAQKLASCTSCEA